MTLETYNPTKTLEDFWEIVKTPLPAFISFDLAEIHIGSINQEASEIIISVDEIKCVITCDVPGYYHVCSDFEVWGGCVITQKQMNSLKNEICKYKITLE